MKKKTVIDRIQTAKALFSQRTHLVRRLAGIMQVRRHQIVFVVLFSLVLATLDAVGLGLLLPLAEGVVANDFSAVVLPNGLNQLVNWSLTALQLQSGPATMFLALAAVIFAANLLGVITGFLNITYGQYLQGKYQYFLHTFVYNRYFSFGKAYFDKTSQGSIKKVLEYTTQITRLVRVLQNNLSKFTQLLAHMVLLFWLSWQLMLLVLLVAPALYVLSRIIMREVNGLWSQAKDITLAQGQESFNMLSALPLVWSYSREREAKEKYSKMSETFRKVQLRAQVLGDFTVTIPSLMTLVTMAIVVGYIGWTMQRGAPIDLTRMMIFLYVASRTVPLFKVFNTVWVVMSEITPPVQEVMRLFDHKNKHIVAEGPIELGGLREHIEIRNLTFAYDGRASILENVSFDIPKGKLTALAGPSGAGKSTVINLLMRFYECPPASIFIDGVDIREFTLASLRNQVAIVDQEPLLLNDSLRNNLTYGLDQVSDEVLLNVVVKTRLEQLVNRLPKGLNTLIGDRGVQLSGGEKQRVAIARAMLKGAELLLLDEATSSLDSETERDVQVALTEAISGRTALVIAHRLSTVRAADNIVYLQDGKVLEQGNMEELIRARNAFANQWQMQVSNS